MILIIFLLAACSPTKSSPLQYQTYPFFAKGSLMANGIEYCFEVIMNDRQNAELKFSSPDSLKGYTFNVKGENTTLSYGDMTIDFSNNGEKTNIVNLIPSLFSLSEDNITSSEQTTQNSTPLTVLTFKDPKGDITLHLNNSTGMPLRFEQNKTVVNVTELTPLAPSTPSQTQSPNTTPQPTNTPPATPWE